VRIFILGCGRLGAALAQSLDQKGHDVTVLDIRTDAFARLGQDFGGRTVQGDGLEIDVLEKAGLPGCDVFVACTSGDNRNLTASQFAMVQFGVPKVISKVSDPLRGQIYEEMGVHTISPTVVGADILYNALMDVPDETTTR
jgi:trk system potassium uptake protein TrkA